MPTTHLPENPSLENLKKQAKDLLRGVRSGDAEALERVRELHPRGEAALARFSLAAAQLVIARRYRFASWARLKRHLEVVDRFLWDPEAIAAAGGASPPRLDTFLRDVCLLYDNQWQPSNAVRARSLLAEHPELSRADLYAAAAAGDVAAARDLLASDPSLVNRRGGVLGWEPLLYACYSRLESTDRAHSTFEVARLLLDAGADPNAGFLWRGNIPPFTALTGAFGDGERGSRQPEHPQAIALARLLLDAGADPNDEQTLYNRHFRSDDAHFRLLLEYRLGRDRGGPWFRRLGDRLARPPQLLVEELWSAARKGFFARVELLVAHGTDLDGRSRRDGRTPYEAALRSGYDEIAAYLLRHGATKVALDPREAFAAACIGGQRDEVQARLAADPGLVDRLGRHGRLELLHRAVEARRPAGVRLMAELGFELSGTTYHDGVGINLAATPLHNAAWIGDLELVELLVGLGADPSVRDPNYHGTPLDWAAYNSQPHVVEYLRPLTPREEEPA